MHSIKNAFRFIWASFSLAIKKDQLQEQWLYIAVGNLLLLLIWFLPLGLTVGLIGVRPVGMSLIGLVSIFLLVSFYMWGEITKEGTSQKLENLAQENPAPENNEAQKVSLFEHWDDILVWTMVKPVLGIQYHLQRFLWPDREENSPWFESHFLIIPLISLENLSLEEAISRVRAMISDHLLRFKPGFVKIDLVARLVQWTVGLIGILTGFSTAILLGDLLSTNPWQRVMALGISFLIAWFFLTLGNLFSAFIQSIYHTALYQWVMNVKAARTLGDPSKAVPPEILRRSLGQSEIIKNKKER